MFFPPFIKNYATIGLAAPAGHVAPEVVDQAKRILGDAGFKVISGRYIDQSHHQFAASDTARLADLQQMLDHPDIDIILCLRGGYGTIRIVEQLDFTLFKKHPKWLIGFSDITVLHAAFQNEGISSIHAAMPKSWRNEEGLTDDFNLLLKFLKGEWTSYNTTPHPLNRAGEASGVLRGGNLSLLYALRGTPYDFNPDGTILFIEDLSEYLYHIDRMMHNLKLGGVLRKISGLVVGHFTDLKDNNTPFGQTVEEIIMEAVREYDYPVLFGFPAGHQSPNYPMVLGSRVKVTVDNEGGQLSYI